MIWRSIRSSHFLPATCPGNLFIPPCRRWLSNKSSPSAYQNIATILDFRPSTEQQESQPIVVTGHVRTVRNQKARSFVEIGDGSSIHSLQAIVAPWQAVGLGTGTAVRISGQWRSSPQGKEQSYELHAEDVQVVGISDPQAYPIQKKYHSPEYLRTIPHLRLRTPFNALLARLRSDCDFSISQFFQKGQFVRTQPPIITSSDCEGAGEVFALKPKDEAEVKAEENKGSSTATAEDFFRQPKYLTVSSQLHLEAFVHEHKRVWTLSPTFRAEKSDTSRHLAEFYMLEAEIRTETLKDVMDLVENTIRHITLKLGDLETGKQLLEIEKTQENDSEKWISSSLTVLGRRWQGLRRAYWPRITYTRAMRLLQAAVETGKATFKYPPKWDTGLQLEHEKFIVAEAGHGSPVFVTDYPKAIKPFYMLPSTAEPEREGEGQPEAQVEGPTVACFDLLLPEICEVVGGSLREHRLEPLLESMKQNGLLRPGQQGDTDTSSSKGRTDLDWYLDLRRYGSVPHGGFGLGYDRLLGYLAGVDNVRDVTPWPRYYGRCDC